MAEINNKVSGEDLAVTDLQPVTLRDIIAMVINKWYWFVISVFVCLLVAGLYIMRTTPVYQRQATILVKDNRKGSGMTEMGAFGDLAGFSTRRNVDNELFVLQARRLMLQVVDNLGLTTSYTTRKGLRKVDLYHNSPIEVEFVNDNINAKGCSFRVEIGEDSARIYEFNRGNIAGVDTSADADFEVTTPYDEKVITPYGEVIIKKNPVLLPTYIGSDIKVVKYTREAVASAYRGAVQSAVANKMSAVIQLSLKDVSAKRAEDILNALIAAYNDDAVRDKQLVTEATAEFIDERLSIISKELGSVDSQIKDIKTSTQVIDVQSEVKKNMTEGSALKSQILEIENHIEMVRFLKDYLNDPSKEYSLIPTAGVADMGSATLASQISDYNELILRRQNLLENSGVNNPTIIKLDGNRVALRNAVVASLDSTIAMLQIQSSNLRKEANKTNLKISSVPAQEQELLTIARQQHIKEELYLYLLNKREENALSLNITESTARVIDSAFGPFAPISPKKSMIMLLAFVLGCAVPFIILYLREILDTTVRGKHDIEKYTHVPYLGDVPVFVGKKDDDIVVRENGRDNISEAFRIIRTNMTFMNTEGAKQQVIMVTSSNAHAGKTFVATNLAMTLAFSGKKVLVIDLDLRRRTLTKHFGQRNNPIGVTKFISDSSVTLNDIVAKSTLHENFDCVYAGLQPPNPAEMLLSKRLDTLIEQCRKEYDYILIDSVPAMVIADALIATRVADLSIYVVREGILDRRQLPDIDALYLENKIKNMSIVLNATSERSHRYGYGYGYGYGYSYSYSYDGDEEKQSWWERMRRYAKRHKK